MHFGPFLLSVKKYVHILEIFLSDLHLRSPLTGGSSHKRAEVQAKSEETESGR